MSFLSFKRSPSKKQLQEDALAEARRKVEIEKIRQQEEEEEEKRQKADEVLTSYKQPRPMEVNPPRSRLNPKLTRRALPPDYEDLPSDDRSKPKTAAKLSHNGKWVPKEFNMGRHIAGTGIWDCCGAIHQFSMYCTSAAARLSLAEQKALKAKEEEISRMYKERIIREVKEPWERGELGMGFAVNDKENVKETQEEMALKASNAFGNVFNAPMLVSWVYKHLDEELTVRQGLEYMQRHVETGEGCVLLHRHDIMMCLIQVYEQDKDKPHITLYVASILRKLLDCNFTRDSIINGEGPGYESTSALRVSFSILHTYMKSSSHVEESLKCVLQCARSESCRNYIVERRIIVYLNEIARMYSKHPEILRSILRTFNWTANTQERLIYVCDIGCIHTVLQCMKRHINDKLVVSPGMQFLARSSRNYPKAANYMLRHKTIEIIVGAIKALYSDEVLQLEALKLLQMMSRTTEGWQQISSIKGGWQAILQGTAQGNALVHDLPGSLNNPGWAIGDTPNLPVVDRAKLEVAKVTASITRAPPKAAWTSTSFKEYTGKSMKAQSLAINNEFDEEYFKLIKTLDMLPRPGEEMEYYFIRIDEYEKENDISMEEMTNTIIEMKKAAEAKAKRDALSEESGELIKPIYFMGQKYSAEELAEQDQNIVEELHATILQEDAEGGVVTANDAANVSSPDVTHGEKQERTLEEDGMNSYGDELGRAINYEEVMAMREMAIQQTKEEEKD